jgi:hypothetical protein
VTAFGVEAGDFVLPPERPWNPNPLELPPAAPIAVEVNQRIFAVPRDMLAAAKPGHLLALHAAHVVRVEGDLWVVREGHGEAYIIHPAYVVVPKPGRFARETPVIAAYRGRLHHGVVKHLLRDRVVVRFTDLRFRLGDQKLDPTRVGVTGPGLSPGGHAVYPTESGLAHVLLVSRGDHPDGKARWLTIGYGGAAELIDEERLRPLPVGGRFRPRVGDTVRAAYRGTMVMATLREIDRPGWYTVKRERAGAPLLIGPTEIMPAGD